MKANRGSATFRLGGVLLFLGLGIYYPALHGDWIWDDTVEVVGNSAIRGPVSALADIWLAPAQADYFPVKTTVQWIEWHAWGDSRLGWHLTSVLLHIASACLLWRVLSRMGVGKAWWGGLLFLVHPLAVESVAWISELKNTLSLALMLLAWNAHLGACEEADGDPQRVFPRSEFKALGWFIAAMLAKSSVVMFPVCLLLHSWWRRGRIARRDLFRSAPFFAVALALGAVTVAFQQQRAIGQGDFDIGSWEYRAAASGAHLLFYLGKFIWPDPLMALYVRRPVAPLAADQVFAWIVLGILAAALWRWRSSLGRGLFFGLGCSCANLFPVLGIVPMSYLDYAWVADHFAYVSLAGLAGLSAGAAGVIGTRIGARSAALARGAGALAVVALAALALASHRRAALYDNALTFWQTAAGENPKSWAAHHNLAESLARIPGRRADAVAEYEETLRLKPDFAGAHNNLAAVLADLPGRKAEAEAHYMQALRLNPNYAEAENNWAQLLEKQPGRESEAASHFEAALRLNPGLAVAHYDFGNFWANQTGREPLAREQYEAALRLNPDYAMAHNNLALLLERDPGRSGEAIAHFERALRAEPDRAEVRNNFANLLAALPGRGREAIAQYEAALRLSPNAFSIHFNLANALSREPARLSEAVAHYESALRLKPDFAEAHFNLALALANLGRVDEAIRQLRLTLALRPDFQAARDDLARLLPPGP